MAAGVTGEAIHHEDVMEVGRRVEQQFTALLAALVPQIAAASTAA
jgi:purine-nucleoside phosphorylase